MQNTSVSYVHSIYCTHGLKFIETCFLQVTFLPFILHNTTNKKCPLTDCLGRVDVLRMTALFPFFLFHLFSLQKILWLHTNVETKAKGSTRAYAKAQSAGKHTNGARNTSCKRKYKIKIESWKGTGDCNKM